MNSRPVVLAYDHDQDAEKLGDALAASDVNFVETAGSRLILTRDLLHPRLEAYNHERLRDGEPWLAVHPRGDATWVGPLFLPGRTACGHCYTHRLHEAGWRVPEGEWTGGLDRVAAEILRWLEGDSSRLAGRILEFTPRARPVIHHLAPQPACPVCGGSQRALWRPPASIPRNTASRRWTPEKVVRRLMPLTSKITGIVTGLEQRPSRGPFAVWAARHHRPLPAGGWTGGARPQPQPVMGKGISGLEAKAGCLAEAVERYSIQWQGHEERIMATASELGADGVVLEDLMLISERQFAQRERWNREEGGFNWIPDRAPRDQPMEWCPVWSLTARRRRYVPAAYCYLYYPARYCLADSNGCAAGASWAEAALQGLMELIERDALGIWWANRLVRPRITLGLGSAAAELERPLSAWLATHNRTLHVLDLTHDLGVPCFVAVSADHAGRDILLGSGAHLDAEFAWRRAVSELVQNVESTGAAESPAHGRLTMVEAALRRWKESACLADLPYLRGEGARRLEEDSNGHPLDLKQALETCVQRLSHRGLEVLVLDVSRSHLPLKAVRVIVPGLRHCWARYAPGRLYDVPVELGWRAAPLAENELNPVPYFL